MMRTTDELFGFGVKDRREQLGWSMTELATRLRKKGLDNFHPTTIGRMERGERPIRLSEAQAVVEVFKEEFPTDNLGDYLFPALSGSEALEEYLDAAANSAKRSVFFGIIYQRRMSEVETEMAELKERLENDDIPLEYIEHVKKVMERAEQSTKMDLLDYWGSELEYLIAADEDEVVKFSSESL